MRNDTILMIVSMTKSHTVSSNKFQNFETSTSKWTYHRVRFFPTNRGVDMDTGVHLVRVHVHRTLPAKLTYAKMARGLNQFAFRINNKNQVVCGINIEKVRKGQNTLNDTLRPNHGYVGQKNKNEELNLQTGPIKMNSSKKSDGAEMLYPERRRMGRLFNIKAMDSRTKTD